MAFIFPLPLRARNEQTPEEDAPPLIYIIEDISIQIEGKTLSRILEKRLELEKGRTFESREDLETWLADRQEVLYSQRVLEEGSMTYTVSDASGGRAGVHIFVVARDTTNWIVLPFFKYDSNAGLLLGMRFRDFNFFGSMEELKLNFDYTFGSGDNSNEVGQELAFTIPFQLFQHNWRLRARDELTYKPDSGSWKFDSEVGLAVDFPHNGRDWTLEYVHRYYYDDDDFYGDRLYNESKLLFGTEFALPLTLGRLGALKFGPRVFTRVKYRPDRELSEDRRGVEPGLIHKLFAGRIDWKGNFREGADLSVTNELAYNLQETRWKNSIDWALIGHKTFSRAGLSGRFSGFFQFFREKGPEDYDEVGKPIRGILDDRLRGDAGLFLNLDFPIKMWVWFMAPYMEVLAGPFFDCALIKRKNDSFKLDELYSTAGLEVIVFPKFSRSIFLRASLGLDFEAFLEDHKLSGFAPRRDAEGKQWKRLEAFIGFGHHY